MLIPNRTLPRKRGENVTIRLSGEALDAIDRESAVHKLPVRSLIRAIVGAWLAARGYRVKESGAATVVSPFDSGTDHDPDGGHV